MCCVTKHYKCQKLSKKDVDDINAIGRGTWACYECISSILPVNATCRKRNSQSSKIKIKCDACDGYSYNANNTKSCPWCDGVCHNKCMKGDLGCVNCCDNMIPGFRYHAYELLDISCWRNDAIFNPFNRENFINTIGDQISNEEENNEMWSDISDLLVSCKYKMAKSIPQTKSNELGVLSLNIRSVHKNLDSLLDQNQDYDKYDVICLNETC